MIPALNIVPRRDINGPDARRYDIRDTIYVSPSGKDGYLGNSPNTPQKTLATLKETIQKIKSGNPKDIKIEFLPGKYEADKFFFKDNKFVYFKHDENGTHDYKIIFKSFDGNNRATFDNSKTYTGFVSAGDLWKIQIDEQDVRKCNLVGYINDVKTVPARWPKYGALAQYNTNTYDGIVYMRCLDSSTGFLSAVFDYKTNGGSLGNIGMLGTLDYRSFSNSTITNILSNLPNTTHTPGIFYIPTIGNTSNFRGINIYANPTSMFNTTGFSNIDPYKVCTEKGENTIIREDSVYWFYYKPSNRDKNIGIQNSHLRVIKHASPNMWSFEGELRRESPDNFFQDSRGTFKYALKRENGYTYYEGESPSSTPCIGFNIITPTNLSFENINFHFCMNPITLYTPSSAYRVETNTVNEVIKEYTSNLNISGCHIRNNYSGGIHVVRMNNVKIYKNFIYSSEGSGINYFNGHDILVDNNIIKSTNIVDTRHNGDFGHAMSNLRLQSEYSGGHTSQGLSGVMISNNDLSYSGNNLKTGTCRNLSAFNNKIYNGGFGCNADMACFYTAFNWGTELPAINNKLYNNIIYHARASSNDNFLGNLVYYDGEGPAMMTYDNILVKGQTGIQHTSLNSPGVYNNIIYDTRVAGIVNKGNSGSLPRNTKFERNIIITNTKGDSTPSVAFMGWNGNGVNHRTISGSPYFAEIYNSSGGTVGSTAILRPIAPWKGKIRYSAVSTGGFGTIRNPMIAFDGENWIVGDWNTGPTFADGIQIRLSSYDTSSYENPWDVPPDRWIFLNNTTDTIFTTMSGVRRSAIRRDNTNFPTVSSNYNLFWSLAPSTANIEDNINFFKYSDWGTNRSLGDWGSNSFKQLTSYASIPDVRYKYNDNSLPNIFGEMLIMEKDSMLSDPLFIDVDNFDFNVSAESPAHQVGFEPIDTGSMGVYNTLDDPYWTLSASNLVAQPVINGHKDWSDYTTIPYPYDPMVEYVAPQVD
jgi:hypothetical protein